MQRPLCFDPPHASELPSQMLVLVGTLAANHPRRPHERFPLRTTSQQAAHPHRPARDRHCRHRRRFLRPGTTLRVRATPDQRRAERRGAGTGTARDRRERQGQRSEIGHRNAGARRRRAQAGRRAVRRATRREEDHRSPRQGRRASRKGPAVLRVTARDASLWHFFSGNEAVLQKNITIDITPPTLELIADDRYVNFGGVGAIVYKASADAATSGVKIGDHFFPRLPRPDQGPSGPLSRALRASLQRPARGKADARRHRQGRQHARDARSPTS